MVEQLSFQLPEIDREQTRKAVEGYLETARIYKQIGFVRREIKNTSSYEPRLHGETHAVHSPAEDCAVWNVDKEKKLKEITEKVDKAINRLGFKEREIIQKKYMEAEDVFDYEVYNQMGMSERTYRRIKARAIYKLAFMLRIEKYKEEEQTA